MRPFILSAGCLGGGGVDGAITSAGGPNLHEDRMKLPLVRGRAGVRCPTGQARLTGPNDYGRLNVPYVIHAVGPCYFEYETFEQGDELLQSAYAASLDLAQEAKLEAIAFSLLSAGVFRGSRTVKDVLSIGISTICDWVKDQSDASTLKSVFLCGFNPHECNELVDICEDDLQLKRESDNEAEEDSCNDQEEEKKGDDDADEKKEEKEDGSAVAANDKEEEERDFDHL